MSAHDRGTPAIYYKALNRRFNIMGVDKPLFFLNLGLSSPIALSAHFAWNWDIIAVSIFMIFHAIGIMITRTDPQALEIYRRHIHYRKYYASHSGMGTSAGIIKPSVPFYQGKKGLL